LCGEACRHRGKDRSDGKTGKKTENDLKETRLCWIALFGELVLEEAMDLQEGRLQIEWMNSNDWITYVVET
jgi:hypothetical protein